MNETISIADRYASAAQRLTVLIGLVPLNDWGRPSPCRDWTAREVVEHIVTTETDLLAQRGLLTIEAATSIGAWPNVRDAVEAVLRNPTTAEIAYDGYFGPTTVANTINNFYIPDLLVHRWDLATAVGLIEHATLSDEEAEFLESAVQSYPPEVMRMPGLFGPELAPSPDADRTTRLMAYLGRSA
jgi:uncharacterized protein (TIGR03086 family)